MSSQFSHREGEQTLTNNHSELVQPCLISPLAHACLPYTLPMKATTRLAAILSISLAFFCVEIAIGFRTKSLVCCKSFCSLSINWTEHMVRLWWQMHFTTSMSVLARFDTFIVTYKVPQDIVAYTIALLAAYVQEKEYRPSGFTYALHRAELVGAFFNGVFLLALALSIFLQSIERFVNIEPMKDPRSMLVVGCVGLALNLLSAGIVHGEELGLCCSYADEYSIHNLDGFQNIMTMAMRVSTVMESPPHPPL